MSNGSSSIENSGQSLWVRRSRSPLAPAYGIGQDDSDPRIATLNWQTQTIALTGTDGCVTLHRLGTVKIPTALSTTTIVLDSNLVRFTTTNGHCFDVYLPVGMAASSRDDRPTVYLDQMHWSTLSNAIHDPKRVAGPEFTAARQLIDLALEKKIVLPLSSAHFSETCKWGNTSRRYRLALTMLQLSAGWQLRDPLEVRQFELRQFFTVTHHDRSLIPPTVVTLEPGAVHPMHRGSTGAITNHSLAPRFREATEALTVISSYVNVLLDEDPIPLGATPGWVLTMQSCTDWLATQDREPEQRRASTAVCFFADLTNETALAASRAGITPDDLHHWTMKTRQRDIAAMPCLGLYREMLHEKLVDPSTRWEENDLLDLMYLTCAAAYCDYIVTERQHAARLNSSMHRLGRDKNAYKSLASLVDKLLSERLADHAA